MKISFIATVFNEEKTIDRLLQSVFAQSKMPDEIIIVDGGSTDKTFEILQNSEFRSKNKSVAFKILRKAGNRSVGRNEAIRQATGDIIVCTDAGCELDKDWVKYITEPFENKHIDPDTIGVSVVAGYYAAKPRSIFEKCLVPYVLVMPDKVDAQNFLPATRSMAFTKKIWEKAGGFREKYSYNEDYVFAHQLTHLREGFGGHEKLGAKIVFERNAIVYWQPRKNLIEAFGMFYHFAYGDAEAGILRPKVVLIFARYVFGLSLLASYFIFHFPLLITTVYLLLTVYTAWAVQKNYKYVRHWQAMLILPILQIVSDIAVMLGTIRGLWM